MHKIVVLFLVFILLGIWYAEIAWRFLGLCTLIWSIFIISQKHVDIGVEGIRTLSKLQGKKAIFVGLIGVALGLSLLTAPNYFLEFFR